MLEDVLHDAITGWNTNVTFPATISEMIDARIDYCKSTIEMDEKFGLHSSVRRLRDECRRLNELKEMMRGV